MAQHDYNIGDQNGFDFLVDLNNALSAIVTNNAGSSEPNPTFPHMLWFDTNNDLMKMRNEANSAWVIVAKKDGSGWTPYWQGTALGTAAGRALLAAVDPEAQRTALGLVIGTDIPPKASPTFTGVPTAPTAAAATNTTQLATTAYTRTAIPNMMNASGSAPMYACRAWVNFNGTGTVAIRASGNVSSITDNGVGDYTINFTTALPDANYAMAQGSANIAGYTDDRPVIAGFNIVTAPTSSAARIYVKDGNNDASDSTRVTLSFFR